MNWSRARHRALAMMLVFALSMTTAGCGCPTALLGGVLVAQGSELAIDTDGFVRQIRWPLGYGVRQSSDGLVVTDLLGTVKAREGDRVDLPGGEASSNGAWGVCGEIRVR